MVLKTSYSLLMEKLPAKSSFKWSVLIVDKDMNTGDQF